MLKKLFLGSVITVSLYAFDYDLHPKKVVDRLYCFFGKLENISKKNAGNMVNTCYVQTEAGFVVIDSGPTFDYASQAYTQMQKIAQIPVKYVIITHDHDDHWQGNSFYKSKGALLIGPRTYEQNIVAGMQTRMQRILGKALYGKTKIVKLDTIVENNLTLKVGEKVFQIKQLEDMAHTKGDLVVWLKKESVLFAGDLVFNGRLASLRDGSLMGALEALKKIDNYDAKVIIGGHGYRTDSNATHTLKAYLLQMKQEILKALQKGTGMEEIDKNIVMSGYSHMRLYHMLHKRNVLDAYRELEMMEEDE